MSDFHQTLHGISKTFYKITCIVLEIVKQLLQTTDIPTRIYKMNWDV